MRNPVYPHRELQPGKLISLWIEGNKENPGWWDPHRIEHINDRGFMLLQNGALVRPDWEVIGDGLAKSAAPYAKVHDYHNELRRHALYLRINTQDCPTIEALMKLPLSKLRKARTWHEKMVKILKPSIKEPK